MIHGKQNPSPTFWRGKRVLLTGHTGFKGAWFAYWLHRLGADVTGVSLAPATKPNLFEAADIESLAASHICDIRDAERLRSIIVESQPEVVFHLAAQALVRQGYRDPLSTFSTNVQGTANVLDALRSLDSARVVVAVTTDKVYKNLEQHHAYLETDTLGGHDPYSASKAASEIVIACYRDAYLHEQGVALASARAGNVVGGGDWSEDRLIPDALRAWNAGQPLSVRRPQATRPWQHVLEPLSAYMRLAEALHATPALADAYNFGPEADQGASVREVVSLAQAAYGKGEVNWGDGMDGPHEATLLSLNPGKARDVLGVTSRWTLDETIGRTMAWYRHQDNGLDARSACAADIDAYEAAMAGIAA